MAYWIDALASRSGPLFHAATHFTAEQGLIDDPPRGVAGLGALTRLIGRARGELQDAEDARRFLEGAGAYLALLLLDHWGDASHATRDGVHRLQLGDSGSFDPFAAVARALDAEDTPRTLLEQVKLAEDEAQGHGPTARVVNEVRRVLGALPGARLADRFDQRLWLELDGTSIELDLTRVVEVTRGESDAVLESAVSRLCAPLLQEAAGGELPWLTARDSIVPRLVGPRFIEALPPSRGDLHLHQIGSELWEALVLRTKERARYVRAAEVSGWAAQGVSPRAQAIRNLAHASERARFLQLETAHGMLVMAETRDGLDAARVVLPGLHGVLLRALGPGFLVAVPHRDALIACPSGPAALISEFHRRVVAAFRAAPHAITPKVFAVDRPGALRET